MTGTPDPETDGSRKITMTLRNATSAYLGY
jgi:hypothetical protein